MIKNKFYNEDLNLITDKTERFVVFMNDFKNGMGAWYSIFALRVLPVLLYIIPVNVVLGRMTLYYNRYIDPAFFWNGPVLMIIWVLSIVLLLVLVIIAPKAASVFEFFFGFGYLFFAFRHHLFNNILGISLLVCMIIYMLVKLFFLVVKIIGKIKFSGDAAAGIERDETGRVVQSSEEDVFFTKEKKAEDDDEVVSENDKDFLFDKTEDSSTESDDVTPITDDDFLFAKTSDSSEDDDDLRVAADDDVFFVGKKEGIEIENNRPTASADEDFFFG